MQVLEDDTQKSYSVWFRWGRVGKPGQNSLIPHGPDLDGAIHTFSQKYIMLLHLKYTHITKKISLGKDSICFLLRKVWIQWLMNWFL